MYDRVDGAPDRWPRTLQEGPARDTVRDMALTRRTPQLGELATAVEVELARRGFVDINTAAVDAALNAWVARGRPLCSGSISPRAALRYAPDELPGWIADELEMGESHEPDVAPRIDLMSRQTDLI